MVRGSLETVRLKLGRAEKHLDEITGMLSLLKKGQCRIVTEHNQDRNLLIHRISITPKPPPALSVVIGDFLFAVRSALDHLLWQLVVVNGNFPCTKNMFPITSTPENFTEAAGNRKRLKGVSTEVYALIEGLQPCHRGNESLERLDTLHNVDKHRTLNLTTVVSDNTSLRFIGMENASSICFWGMRNCATAQCLEDLVSP